MRDYLMLDSEGSEFLILSDDEVAGMKKRALWARFGGEDFGVLFGSVPEEVFLGEHTLFFEVLERLVDGVEDLGCGFGDEG